MTLAEGNRKALRGEPFILNRQRVVPVRLPPLHAFLMRMRRQLGLPQAHWTVALVSNAAIARMNEAFRQKKGPTDVLSFPEVQRPRPTRLRAWRPRPVHHPVDVSVTREYLGDIVIAPAIARRNARSYGRTLPRELKVLMLHGVLHLLGYDHENDRGEMNRLERSLRRKLGLS
jgi:probable rRNA maturation factor